MQGPRETYLLITEKRDDLNLLTIAEMRAVAGLKSNDGSQDDILKTRGLAVASGIMSECRVVPGDGNNPTLLQETVEETIESVDVRDLYLSRRFNITISSVTVDGTALDPSEYRAKSESGQFNRLCNGVTRRWCACSMVVAYQAGFADVPPELKQAATDFFRALTIEATRDPYVKSQTKDIPGVLRTETELWSGSLLGMASTSFVPDSVRGQLDRFRN